jgi:hypoxanthine phosphoribosyltransferase
MDKEIGWSKVQGLTKNLHDQVKSAHKKYDWVVSINSGGLVPGVMLAKSLKAKHAVISINNYKEGKKNPQPERDLYLSHIGFIRQHHHILVVDNVIRTGDSILAAMESLKKVDPDAKHMDTATLHLNVGSKLRPTYFAEEIEIEEWIDYPWETLEKH